jgi:hypothetical protein
MAAAHRRRDAGGMTQVAAGVMLVGSLWHSPNSPDSDRIQTFPGFINFDVPNLHTESRQRRIRQ